MLEKYRYIFNVGKVHDVTQAPTLLIDVIPQVVLADKVYDTNALIECIKGKKARIVIPLKANA